MKAVSYRWNDEDVARIERLREKYDATTDIEVMRRALKFLEAGQMDNENRIALMSEFNQTLVEQNEKLAALLQRACKKEINV